MGTATDRWTGVSRVASAVPSDLPVRVAAAPISLGLRWARHGLTARPVEIPSPSMNWSLATKIALDDIFFVSELLSATVVSLSHRRRLANEIEESIAFYRANGWLSQPETYHDTPPPLEQTTLETAQSGFGFYRHLSWESLYAPHEGEPGRDRWLGQTANKTAHAWLFEHPGAPRPWIVCIPGYRMGHHMVDVAGFRVRWLHGTLGLNVAVPVMPLHGPRREGKRGGDGFLSGDFVDTVHAQTQAVWDVRRLIGWLRCHQSAEQIAGYGISLGGYTAALLASLEENLDAAIIGIPASDFVGLLEQHMPELAVRFASWIGFPFESLRTLLKVASPLALSPLVPRDRRFIYAATHDGLAAPSQARDLWRHWERPRIDWYEGSHVSFLWESQVQKLVQDALSAAGMVESD